MRGNHLLEIHYTAVFLAMDYSAPIDSPGQKGGDPEGERRPETAL